MRTITGSNFDRRWRWRERVGGKVRPSTNGVAALSLLSSSSSHRPINGAPIFRTMLFRLVSCRRPRFGVGRRPSSAEILIGAGVGGDARPSTNGVAVPSSSPLSSCHRRINDALLVLFRANLSNDVIPPRYSSPPSSWSWMWTIPGSNFDRRWRWRERDGGDACALRRTASLSPPPCRRHLLPIAASTARSRSSSLIRRCSCSGDVAGRGRRALRKPCSSCASEIGGDFSSFDGAMDGVDSMVALDGRWLFCAQSMMFSS